VSRDRLDPLFEMRNARLWDQVGFQRPILDGAIVRREFVADIVESLRVDAIRQGRIDVAVLTALISQGKSVEESKRSPTNGR
jgi:hypothetical protein